MSVLLDVYGLTVAVGGDWPEVVEAARLDYAWFARPEPVLRPDVEVLIAQRAPDYDAFGDLVASFVTPRGTVFAANGTTVVDHVGRAISVIDRGGDRLHVHGDDEQVVHDAVYYFVLGRVGRHLDRIGLPRLHGLGLAGSGGAVAVLLPPTGGKTTLAVRALQDEGVRLLSEDSPLLDRQGRLHPFPLRIAISASDVPPADAAPRRLERFWLQPKVAMEVETFADRIAFEPVPLRHVVVGRRSLAADPQLLPLGRAAAAGPLLREGVLGVGLYQGLGYAHQRGLRAVVDQLTTAGGRARSVAAALSRARVWQLVLGRNTDRNWELLSTLVR